MSFTSPTILMCPPDYYGIEYEINPWMSRGRQSDPQLAKDQWHKLFALLKSLGADCRLMEPIKGLPDLVFTANAGLIYQNKVFLSQFRHEARQGETVYDEKWFQQAGFETMTLPEGMDFEGAGDALFCGRTLFAGYMIRSDASAMQWVAKEIGCRVIPLQLTDEFYYHLDTCFCPISETEAIYYPPAFDDYALSALKEHVPDLIEVNKAEAARFACNAVVLGKDIVLNTGCPQLVMRLSKRGYVPHQTELGEFIKAGGSAKCLTLRLDGEAAAIWKNNQKET